MNKTRSMAGKQYRVSLHKIGTFLKPCANYGVYNHRWQTAAILKKIGKDAFSKIKNQLTEFEKYKVEL